MIRVLSPVSQSILDIIANAFGWDLCISTVESCPCPTQEQPRLFSWVHERDENGLDHEFWGLGLYIIASRDREPPSFPEYQDPLH